MTEFSTGNGHDGMGGLAPPVTRPRDPTGASRSRRYRDKRKANRAHPARTPRKNQTVEKANEFRGSVTVATVMDGRVNRSKTVTPFAQSQWQAGGSPVTVPERSCIIDTAAYAAAIGLASCAAYFSIRGMTVLFPGAPWAIIAMTIMMESAKLITAGWLARRWRSTAPVWRAALAGFVIGLAVINATGVYAQLVAAHVGERGAATAAVEIQEAELASRIEVAQHAVADLDGRVAQIDAAIAEATRRGRTNAALAAMEGQRRTRSGLMEERNREAGSLAALKAERASVAASGRQAEMEAAPIRYVAAIFGVTDSETAIRWLIALMVLCCDPLAIALTAAASARGT